VKTAALGHLMQGATKAAAVKVVLVVAAAKLALVVAAAAAAVVVVVQLSEEQAHLRRVAVEEEEGEKAVACKSLEGRRREGEDGSAVKESDYLRRKMERRHQSDDRHGAHN
jgi:hypothetical protein